MPGMARLESTSLIRAIAILEVLGSPDVADRGGMGVVQIARTIGREKSQISRTLKSLAQAGFVIRDPESLRYRLGWRLLTLAIGAAEQRLLALAPHVLRQLVTRVGERAHLSVLEGTDVRTVLSQRPVQSIQATGWVGRATPLHCTSAGRALLFDHADDDVRELFQASTFVGPGPKAPGDVEDLLGRLRSARRRGYAAVAEEFEPDLVGVAAPVRDFRGYAIASLNISGPKFRLGRALTLAGGEVKAAADQLTQALGRESRNDQDLHTNVV